MTTRPYDTPRISPKQFLLYVMWDETVDIPYRLQAANSLRAWIAPGDFCEPDLSYQIQDVHIPLQ
jgi:hypothetical protein